MKALILLSSLSLSIAAFAQQVIIQQQTTTTTATSPYFQNPGWGLNTQFQTYPNQFNYLVDPNVQIQTWGTPSFGCADPVMQVQPQYYIDPFTGQPVYVEQFVQPQQQYYVDQFGNYIPVGQPQQQVIYQQQVPVQQQYYQVQPTQVMQNQAYYAPDASSFSLMIQQISAQSFDENRLQVAQQIVMSNRVTSAQVTDIARLFSFESTRLQFAKFAYAYVLDPNSFFMVNNAFTFSSSVDDLHRFITGSR
jgi:hypothetical protein